MLSEVQFNEWSPLVIIVSESPYLPLFPLSFFSTNLVESSPSSQLSPSDFFQWPLSLSPEAFLWEKQEVGREERARGGEEQKGWSELRSRFSKPIQSLATFSQRSHSRSRKKPKHRMNAKIPTFSALWQLRFALLRYGWKFLGERYKGFPFSRTTENGQVYRVHDAMNSSERRVQKTTAFGADRGGRKEGRRQWRRWEG